jgi:hypothetical protein
VIPIGESAAAIARSASAASSTTAKAPLILVERTPIPQPTMARVMEEAVGRGDRIGKDIMHVNYDDLRVTNGVVKVGSRVVVNGDDKSAFFLFRGGGNLSDDNRSLIGAVQSIKGSQMLNDIEFITKAGNKESTYNIMELAGLPLPRQAEAATADEAIAGFDHIMAGGAEGVVLKRVNGLGGKHVHFPASADAAARIVKDDPGSQWVLQELIPAARDQDIRAHLVLDAVSGEYKVANTYVRNRAPGGSTPNLAGGGYATDYVLSPWEERIAIQAAEELGKGSSTKPLHVAMDLFPRARITEETVARNRSLQAELARTGTISGPTDTAVIGEAASSAGTKGTEAVLEGRNPVVEQILDSVEHLRRTGGFERQAWHTPSS